MKPGRFGLVSVAISAVFLTATACGSDGEEPTASGGDDLTGAAPETVTIDYLHWGPLASPEGEAAQEFASEVKERTNGEVEILVRPVGELPYKNDQYLTAVASGGADMAAAYSGFVEGSSKMAGLPQLPFLMSETSVFDEAFPIYQPFLETELAQDFNSEFLFWYPVPVLNAYGKGEPVNSLGDLEGRQIRATSPGQVEMLEALGARPATILTGELAPALQTGVIDGMMATSKLLVTLSLVEAIDWAYMPGFNVAPVYVVINSETMAQISESGQAALKEISAEFQDELVASVAASEAESTQVLADAGVVINAGTAEDREQGRALMEPYWQAYAEEGGPQVEEALSALREEIDR